MFLDVRLREIVGRLDLSGERVDDRAPVAVGDSTGLRAACCEEEGDQNSHLATGLLASGFWFLVIHGMSLKTRHFTTVEAGFLGVIHAIRPIVALLASSQLPAASIKKETLLSPERDGLRH